MNDTPTEGIEKGQQAYPKVSVIMGIYNCADTLSAAIESIIAQTYTNWELIMCDDGSNDNTYHIAENYAGLYPDKIRLLRNETNQRLAASLNHCLKHADGKYVARMDADDISLPDRFQKEVDYLEAHPDIDCVGTGYIPFDERGDRGVRIGREYPDKEGLMTGVPFAHPTIMMKGDVYNRLGGYTSTRATMRAEDVDLWFRFFAAGYKGYVIQEPLYRYRESIDDYGKRSIAAAVGTTRVSLNGYRLLSYPFWVYPLALKPIVVALIPKHVMFAYHSVKDRMQFR